MPGAMQRYRRSISSMTLLPSCVPLRFFLYAVGHRRSWANKLSIYHRVTGCVCPNCRAPLPLGTIFTLLGDENVSAPLKTIRCLQCGEQLRAKGHRWDQALRLLAVFSVLIGLTYLLWGEWTGLAVSLVLAQFSLRIVGIEVVNGKPAPLKRTDPRLGNSL